MVETGWGEDTLKLEPDLPPGEGPAEGSSGEPTDVFQEAWRAAPATQMARLCGQGGGYPAQHAPPLPGPRRPGAGERERRESLQTTVKERRTPCRIVEEGMRCLSGDR